MSRRSLADIKDKIAKVRRQEEEKENQNPQLSQKETRLRMFIKMRI